MGGEVAKLSREQQENHKCVICDQPRSYRAKYCKTCSELLDRIETRKGAKTNRGARLKALQDAWDGKCFRCYYTGWPLCVDKKKHQNPYYLVWEHRTPRDEQDIVVAANLINSMKSDLTEEEFQNLILGLAKRYQGSGEMVPLIEKSFRTER